MTEKPDYAGKVGVLYLRVSDRQQEKMYGFAYQERQCRLLADQLGIIIIRVIKDTYTGMEFRDRPELTVLRDMAKHREFEVALMWKLDRLGRKGIQREIVREELKYHGVTILTTDPDEHADDDSPLGEVIRETYGFNAERERNDLILRTTGGKWERALSGKLLGTGFPLYGYKWKSNNPKEKDAYVISDDPITIDGVVLTDENGEAWTEIKVVRTVVMFADNRMPFRAIAAWLTKRRIPTRKGAIWTSTMVERYLHNRQHYLASDSPILAYGYLVVSDEQGQPWTEASVAHLICSMADQGNNAQTIGSFLTKMHVPTGREALWQAATVYQMLSNPFYTGEASMFKRQDTEKKQGHKQPTRILRSEEDQIKMPDGVVPQIIDKELFERVQLRLQQNKREAPRNNKNPHECLLRSGHAICGYCGGNAHFRRHKDRFGIGKDWCFYVCTRGNSGFGRCKGCSIAAHIVHDAAWEAALEIIYDPSQADKRVERLRAQEDPNAGERTSIKNKIARIEQQQKVLRQRLTQLTLDKETEEWLSRELRDLAEKKKGYEGELKTTEDRHDKYTLLQSRLAEFHQRCQELRENPEFTPSDAFKRDAIDFFGITAIIWQQDHKPHYKIESNPPLIVSLLS